ncbi:MAG: hypothetical protein KF678_15535 [Phycisphaeraceae bacterium]|nr:hypothetical protein [Phycisphaeraceae bacterium]
MLTIARGLMRGRDRDHRESMDIAQSLAKDLIAGDSGFRQLDPASQRRFLQIAIRNKLAAKARGDGAQKRGGAAVDSPQSVDGLGVAASRPGPGTLACERAELHAMREGLDQLDPETRSVLKLHLDGVPHDVIAQLFETTDTAVRQRFVRAKRDLIILGRRAAGQSWEEVGASVGLTAEEAHRRHERLTTISKQ